MSIWMVEAETCQRRKNGFQHVKHLVIGGFSRCRLPGISRLLCRSALPQQRHGTDHAQQREP